MSFDASTTGNQIWTDQHHRDGLVSHSRSRSQQASMDANYQPQTLELHSETGQFEHQVYKGSKGRHARPGSAFHPYKSFRTSPPPPPTSQSPPPVPSVPVSKPIHFIDATFQPNGTTDVSQSSGGVALCRPKRKKITQAQLTKLIETFNTTDNPGFEIRDNVGKEIGMSNREVQVWFQNRRAKVTRERANALAKANPTRAPLLSQERLPSPTRASQLAPTNQSSSSHTGLSAAQHQWRYSNPDLAQASTPRASQERPNGLPSSRHGSPEAMPHYRKMFGEQKIVLPRSTSPLPSPEVSSNASETSSSYFANSHTPPLSYTATTPGAESPRWASTRGFSNDHGRIANSAGFVPFGSPSSAFGQLALRSPPIHSAISEREPFFFASEMPSPTMSEPGEMIRLAPIRPQWNPSMTPKPSVSFALSRRRSLSNPEHLQTAERRPPNPTRPSHVRLPSIRDLLNPVVVIETPGSTPSLTPSISTASTSASPVTPSCHSSFVAYPSRSATPHRPNLASRHTADVLPSLNRPAHRRFPSSETGLTGLGVLSEYHPAPRAQPGHSLYSHY